MARQFLLANDQVYSLDRVPSKLEDGKFHEFVCDVCDGEAVEKAVKGFSLEKVDVFVYAVGMLRMGSLIEQDISVLRNTLEANLIGMAITVKAFSEPVIKAKGRFVLFSSEVGKSSAHPFNGAYSISKHAVEAYADSLRRKCRCLA